MGLDGELIISCDECGSEYNIDINSLYEDCYYDDNRSMGTEVEHEFSGECECDFCGNNMNYIIRAFEYPAGAFNHYEEETHGCSILKSPNVVMDNYDYDPYEEFYLDNPECTVEEIIERRDIKYLYHFTQADNLKNIFKYGLMPRNILDRKSIFSNYNDKIRLDGYSNSVSLSVGFPNYKMFFRLRNQCPEIKWAVLKIDAKVICDLKCAFYWENAASNSFKDILADDLMDAQAFDELFQDRKGYPSRERLNIPNNYPTNPQAEVLVFDVISPEYIETVAFQTNSELQDYFSLPLMQRKGIRDSFIFGPRKDYTYWQRRD